MSSAVDATTIKATIATLTAAGLDVSIDAEGGVVTVTDTDTGGRYVVRDPDAWTPLRHLMDRRYVIVTDFLLHSS